MDVLHRGLDLDNALIKKIRGCKDKDIIAAMEHRQLLFRRLFKFMVENDPNPITDEDWKNYNIHKYFASKNENGDWVYYWAIYCRDMTTVYFST